MIKILPVLFALSLSSAAMANTHWNKVEAEARGQTVYFNAWGGGENINAYIDWAAKQAKQKYGVTVKHVKVTDAADVVKRIKTEVEAGRIADGSVDFLWVNGENFKALKQGKLLYGPWAESLPNWSYVDLKKPVQVDFSEPTDGLEMPWGTAQLTFIANQVTVKNPPRSAQALLAFAKANVGQVSYPKPPDFHGTTFIKQLLLELNPDTKILQQPVNSESMTKATASLWAYLDQLHPALWRKGNSFPKSAADMNRMLADGELKLSLTFNPNEAANLIATQQLPKTAYSFGFSKGTIGNVHFLAIPSNAKSKAGAQVFANFLLSPEAQAKKADLKIWGDPSVLAIDKIPAQYRQSMQMTAPGALAEKVPTLAEPHSSWVAAIEAEWLKRYGAK
ncbi:ABC transporter substrate-binding protein [Iodobacter ciconiae]|uniref:ABC transporter substrate-binding protein n=1 Tax=Iodobacter ciconiae TaxID=2496266 RepID=A0A3S8ZRS0_9NEIS|nr:ABC transporter substrate-binding protein [Iodobacter ciconiae]AZN36182.1 ABC transporter substrate-binding protein [Iodobacter ciconiae]